MNKSLKNHLDNAITLGFLCFIASLCTYLAKEQLDPFTFIHFILPTFFIVTIISFVMDLLLKK